LTRIAYAFARFLLYVCLGLGLNSTYGQTPLSIVAARVPLPLQISDLCKDKSGRLWLATQDGLYLFDGQEAIKLPKINTAVQQIKYSNHSNKLWALTKQGLFLIDCNNFSSNFFKGAGTGSDSKIENDPLSNRLLFFSNEGVLYHVSENGIFETIVNTGITPRKLTVLKDGTLYFTDRSLLYRYVMPTRQFSLVRTGIAPPVFSGLWNSGDMLMIGTWYVGLRMLDGKLRDSNSPYLANINETNEHLTLAARNGNQLFLGFANNSFYVADLVSGHHYNLSNLYEKVFTGVTYNCYLVDGANTLWIGTSNGLIKISITPQLFGNILSNHSPPISSRALVKSSDGFFAASYSGIFHQTGNNPWQRLNSSFAGNEKFLAPYALLESGSYIYMVGETDFFYRYNKKDHTVNHTFYRPIGKQGLEQGFCLAQETDGKIWVGTTSGIAVYDTATRELSFDVTDRYGLEGKMVKDIYTNDSLLMAATDSGLCIYHKNSGRKKRIGSDNYPLMKNNDLQFVRPDDKGNVLAAGKGGGIYIYNLRADSLSNLNTSDGLSDNVVYAIAPDNKNGIWASTQAGLSHYDFSSKTFDNYYEKDGLSNDEFNHNSFLKDEKGRLYFGGVNGINFFHPDSIMSSGEAFSVYIFGVKKWDRSGQESMTPAKGLHFVKATSDLSMGIMVGVSNYANEEPATYWYKVREIADQWQEIKSSNVLRLDGLPYGTYEVAIRALNERGRFSENTLFISVDLESPFYYKWWFLLLLSLTIFAIAYAMFRYKVAQINKYQQLRVQIASDMHDEVGSILTSIGMYSDNLMNNKNVTDTLQHKVSKIATLSREAIVSMRDIVWAIDARNDVSGNLAAHIRSHAEEMLLPKNISLHLNFNVEGAAKALQGNDRQHLYFIIKEAINNIAKHSNAENVFIDLTIQQKKFALTIRNDGATAESVQRRGQGLRNMALRSQKIGAHFERELQDGFFTVRVHRP